MPGLILFIFDLIIYYYYKFPMLYFPNRFFKEHILFIKYCSFWLFCFLVAYLIPNSGWFIWNIIGLNVDLIIFVIIFQLESPNFLYHADALPKHPDSKYLWFFRNPDKPGSLRRYSRIAETYFNPIFVAKFYCYVPVIIYLFFCVFNPNWFFFEFLFLFCFLWLDFYDEMGNDMIESNLDEDLITPVRFLKHKKVLSKHEYPFKRNISY